MNLGEKSLPTYRTGKNNAALGWAAPLYHAVESQKSAEPGSQVPARRHDCRHGCTRGSDNTGRKRNGGISEDLINRGGYKIYPHELECILVEHPKLEQVCIVATPNPARGEYICACVIPQAGQTVTLEEIREMMQDQIALHKLPDELCIMEDFPKLSGGIKIKKFGPGGLTQLAGNDATKQKIRKK